MPDGALRGVLALVLLQLAVAAERPSSLRGLWVFARFWTRLFGEPGTPSHGGEDFGPRHAVDLELAYRLVSYTSVPLG